MKTTYFTDDDILEIQHVARMERSAIRATKLANLCPPDVDLLVLALLVGAAPRRDGAPCEG